MLISKNRTDFVKAKTKTCRKPASERQFSIFKDRKGKYDIIFRCVAALVGRFRNQKNFDFI